MAFVVDYLRHGNAGTEGQFAQLIRGLAARGIHCHVTVLQPSDYQASSSLPCEWTVLGHSRLAAPGSWLAMYRLGRKLRQQGYRLAHCFFNDASVLAPPMLTAAGLRTLISRRDMGFWYTPAYRRLLRFTGRWVAGCIANSRAVAEVTQRCERLPANRVYVIANGLVDESTQTQPVVTELEALAKKGRVLCGVVANIRPIKRIGDLVAALGRVAESAPKLDVVVIGAGEAAPLAEQAEQLGVAERLHLLGPREDVAACLRYLDIAALCSESEGFSNSLVEYMTAGLAVVCTNAGGNPEAIEHGRTGLLYPVGDVDALASHLLDLAGDAEHRYALGTAAAAEAKARFSVERMIDEHVDLYARMLTHSDSVDRR